MKLVKYTVVAVILLVIVILVGYRVMPVADIRPASFKESGINEAGVEKGKALLQKSLRSGKHGLMDSVSQYKLVLSDHWQGLMGKASNPWPDEKTKIRMTSSPGSYDFIGVEFLEGVNKGETWGHESGNAFIKPPDGEKTYVEDENIQFILPTFKYFFEFYRKIQEAEIISWIEDREHDNTSYHLVFATWKTFEPNEEFDQYVVWINAETNLIDYVEYTVRDAMKFATGLMHFSDYRDEQGILIPFKQTVSLTMEDKDYLHQVSLESVEFR